MKREARCLYRALLKVPGKVLSVKKMIAIYRAYEEFTKHAAKNDETPKSLKIHVTEIETPQYLKWIEQYLVEEDKV